MNRASDFCPFCFLAMCLRQQSFSTQSLQVRTREIFQSGLGDVASPEFLPNTSGLIAKGFLGRLLCGYGSKKQLYFWPQVLRFLFHRSLGVQVIENTFGCLPLYI